MQSENIDELAAALAAFQAEVKDPTKNRTADMGTYTYKFLDFTDAVVAVRPVLAGQGVAFAQFAISDGDSVGVITMLMHKSGQWIKSEPFMLRPEREGPQAIGSALTYAKRYSLLSILGVAGDEDDDAQAAEPKPQKPKGKPEKGKWRDDPVSEPQLQTIHALAEDLNLSDAEKAALKESAGVESTSKLNKGQASDMIDGLLSQLVEHARVLMADLDVSTADVKKLFSVDLDDPKPKTLSAMVKVLEQRLMDAVEEVGPAEKIKEAFPGSEVIE